VLDIYSSLSLIWRYSYCPVFQGATSLNRKVNSKKSVATLAPVSSDSFVPRPARRKKVIINCSLLKSDGCSTAERRERLSV
ncbi:hypothetical protein M8B82_09225, partial [Enterobacter hormaechei subsp. xiangfangensis]|uniref:hypothetical protein n=1 Tax=Enterobacter hormaechei TaxID=158836 RepID=UPI0022382966